ncbi:MAG: D-aminoacyl-tRNA deacylase [Acidilobaceae archaeon]
MAKFAIVYSLRDPAGLGSAKMLVDILKARSIDCPGTIECFTSEHAIIAGFDLDVIDFEFLDERPDPSAEAVIVLSRHSSESKRKTLSVHHVGNPTMSSWGGEPYTLSFSYPALSKSLLLNYRRIALEENLYDYDITLEATHHGPTRPVKPIVFIEIGSTEAEWRDERAQRVLALTVAETISKPLRECKPAIGLGGTHYPERFTRMHLESDICFGHIIARYQLNQGVPNNVIKLAITKSYPRKAEVIVAEKKSLKREQRELIENIVAELSITVDYH